MPAHAVSPAKLSAALAAWEGGASAEEAAAGAGIGVATLKRYKARQGTSVGAKASKPAPTPRRVATRRAGAAAASADPPAEEPPGAGDDGGLLADLRRSLRYALQQRREATTDAARRGWSKEIRDTIAAINRIAPAPPPPPDEIAQALRRLDADALAIIEQHLPDPIRPEEIAA
ncbi:MAG TPA: hypothetical protein VLT61_12160 [Anaeromyxobacteraceae bacterium]|nr:hypothetical protein [Anaeromyxobacteraceae bacterium]